MKPTAVATSSQKNAPLSHRPRHSQRHRCALTSGADCEGNSNLMDHHRCSHRLRGVGPQNFKGRSKTCEMKTLGAWSPKHKHLQCKAWQPRPPTCLSPLCRDSATFHCRAAKCNDLK